MRQNKTIGSILLDVELVTQNDIDQALELQKQTGKRLGEVLVQLGRGKSAQEAADSLSINVNTIYTYRRRILEKMGLHSTGELIQYVVQHEIS